MLKVQFSPPEVQIISPLDEETHRHADFVKHKPTLMSPVVLRSSGEERGGSLDKYRN